MGVNCLDTYTNFIHLDLGSDLKKIVKVFQEKNILVRGGLPISGYKTYLRLSIGPRKEMKVVTETIRHYKGK